LFLSFNAAAKELYHPGLLLLLNRHLIKGGWGMFRIIVTGLMKLISATVYTFDDKEAMNTKIIYY